MPECEMQKDERRGMSQIEGYIFLIGYGAGIIMGLFAGWLLFTKPNRNERG